MNGALTNSRPPSDVGKISPCFHIGKIVNCNHGTMYENDAHHIDFILNHFYFSVNKVYKIRAISDYSFD
ncbi:hypothetical protein BLOT_013324 [Blomia tropicalis]|nr:hypothetical protein BLOT_013324 [Blomia tropicalis]